MDTAQLHIMEPTANTPDITEWFPKLCDAVEASVSKPFIWGENDCLTLAATCYEVIKGKQPLAVWPKYTSEEEAFEVMSQLGYQSLADLLSAFATPLLYPFAGRGDLGLVLDRVTTVCLGNVWVGIGLKGRITVSRQHITKAYRIA